MDLNIHASKLSFLFKDVSSELANSDLGRSKFLSRFIIDLHLLLVKVNTDKMKLWVSGFQQNISFRRLSKKIFSQSLLKDVESNKQGDLSQVSLLHYFEAFNANNVSSFHYSWPSLLINNEKVMLML